MSLRKQLNEYKQKYPYPRRRFIRRALRGAIRMAASVITDYRVEGQENLPKQGPLLIVGNHFHFLDTIGPIHCTDYFLEFINDSVMPNAPATMKFLPSLWGTLKILQGTANLEAMRASEAVLAQGAFSRYSRKGMCTGFRSVNPSQEPLSWRCVQGCPSSPSPPTARMNGICSALSRAKSAARGSSPASASPLAHSRLGTCKKSPAGKK